MSGWIKLHRDLLNWEHRREEGMLELFVTLLLLAEHTPGNGLLRGQVKITKRELADEIGIRDIRKLEYRLSKLIKSNELSVADYKTGPKGYTIFTITNYEKYQCKSSDLVESFVELTGESSENIGDTKTANNETITSGFENDFCRTDDETFSRIVGINAVPPYKKAPPHPLKELTPLTPQEEARKNGDYDVRMRTHTREWWEGYKAQLLEAYFDPSRQESLISVCRQLRTNNSPILTIQEMRRLAEICVDEWHANEMPPDSPKIAFANLTSHIRQKFFAQQRQQNQQQNGTSNRFGYNSEEARQQRQNEMLEYIRIHKPGVFADGADGG